MLGLAHLFTFTLTPGASPGTSVDRSATCPYQLSVAGVATTGIYGSPSVAFALQPTDLMTRAWPFLTTSRCGPEGRACSLRLSQEDQEVTLSSQGRAHAEQPRESSRNKSQRVMSPELC